MTARGSTDWLAPRLEAVSISLTREEMRLLDEYWSLLARWNARMNLTALPLDGHPSESVDRLIVEPLVAVPLLPPPPLVWFDLGSGGGSPAIPIKIASHGAGLVMVESRSRKTAFLREVVRTLGLRSTEVLTERIEDLAERRPAAADAVTVRAVRPDETLLTAARRLLKPSGRMILFEQPEPSRELIGFATVDELSVPALRTRLRVVVPRGTKD